MVSIVEDSVANKMMSERRDLLESHFKAAEVRRPHSKAMVQLVWFQAARGMPRLLAASQSTATIVAKLTISLFRCKGSDEAECQDWGASGEAATCHTAAPLFDAACIQAADEAAEAGCR